MLPPQLAVLDCVTFSTQLSLCPLWAEIGFSAGFTDPSSGSLPSVYLEQGPGSGSGGAVQVGGFLVTQPLMPAPDFFLPQR